MNTPRVSFVLATYNRRDVVRQTLAGIRACGLPPGSYDIHMVDNASTDGTPDAFAHEADVNLWRLTRNAGSCAKGFALPMVRSEFTVFLDDDSYPQPGSIERMFAHFAADPRLGAAGFTVHLPDGSQECSALPHVFVGCGVGFRTRALREVEGIDTSFFMQAEEYDLAFRLLRRGWRVETCGDLAVHHGKSPQARRSDRTTYLDTCNNLRVIARYLPQPYARIYRQDWLRRYQWLAARAGHETAFARGVRAGRRLFLRERPRYAEWRLGAGTLADVFEWPRIERQMRQLRAEGVRRIGLLDLGKNAYAYVRGARAAGLDIAAIGADAFVAPDRVYRGIPITSVDECLTLPADALVVANTSYVHADVIARRAVARTPLPVHNWTSLPQALSTEPLSTAG